MAETELRGDTALKELLADVLFAQLKLVQSIQEQQNLGDDRFHSIAVAIDSASKIVSMLDAAR